MDSGLSRLQFGAADEDSLPTKAGDQKGKGKHKGKGRGKTPTRYLQPVEKGCFKHSPPEVRSQLGSLVLSKYPFTVSVRSIKEEHYIEAGAPPPQREPKKRSTDGDGDARAKRTPTPDRGAPHGRGSVPSAGPVPVPDPWATALRNTASPSAPQPELAFGSRISA